VTAKTAVRTWCRIGIGSELIRRAEGLSNE
jgi:hypothetical protein